MQQPDALLLVSAFCHVLWFLIGCANSDVRVVAFNNETLNQFDDEPAAASFGKSLPYFGICGHIAYTDPPDACQKVELPPNATDWIAVISKSANCGFHDQVSQAERARFIAAIVYNNESNVLIEMTDPSRRRVNIPSTFIGLSSSHMLEQYDRRLDVKVCITPPSYEGDEVILIILAGVSSFSAIVVLGIVVGIGVHNCCRNRAQLLSRWKLKRLPLHTFKKGDFYENCAICLEEYEEGEKLRILPCAHAFHSKCIDVWLTKNKKTCPLCNETVDPRRRKAHPQSGSQSERTPLLSPATDGEGSDEQGSRSDLSRNQSSVEVHEEPRTSGRINYGTNQGSSVPAFANLSAPLDLCPEDDTLFAISGEVNTLGQSPLCHVEAEPNRARFLPVSETGDLPPARKEAARHSRRHDSAARANQQPEVITSGRKSNRGSDNIV